MLKSKIIAFKYRARLKKNLSESLYNYHKASRVAVLYNTTCYIKYQIKQLISQLRQEGKEVNALGFHPSEHEQTPPSSINLKQFDFFGSLKPNEDLDNLLSNKYDLAICIDESDEMAINYLLTKIKSSFKVGIYDHADFSKKFDLILKCADSEDKANEILKYLKIIESNE